jgi:hypothetical protein
MGLDGCPSDTLLGVPGDSSAVFRVPARAAVSDRQNLQIDEFSPKIDTSLAELIGERDTMAAQQMIWAATRRISGAPSAQRAPCSSRAGRRSPRWVKLGSSGPPRIPAATFLFDLFFRLQTRQNAVQVVLLDSHLRRELRNRDPGLALDERQRLRSPRAAAFAPAGTPFWADVQVFCAPALLLSARLQWP